MPFMHGTQKREFQQKISRIIVENSMELRFLQILLVRRTAVCYTKVIN